MSELLTVKIVLARLNLRLVDLRRALGHRHDDEPWWQERGQTVREAHHERRYLRADATLLHTVRASSRGRIHGAFATLDDQRAWLAKMDGTLANLRASAASEVAA